MKQDSLFEQGKKTTIIAAFTTIIFAAAKAIVGFLSGSIVLLADAVHSLADSVSAFFVWLGLRIAQKKPTERFPYGFYKAENITALLISLLILFAGYEIFKESINRVYEFSQLSIPFVAVCVALIDAIVMFFIGMFVQYSLGLFCALKNLEFISIGSTPRRPLIMSWYSFFIFTFSIRKYFGFSPFTALPYSKNSADLSSLKFSCFPAKEKP